MILSAFSGWRHWWAMLPIHAALEIGASLALHRQALRGLRRGRCPEGFVEGC
jgi:hypothetical protein